MSQRKTEPQTENSLFSEIYKIASSLELAVILFAIIGILTAIGTLIVQNEPAATYYHVYGQTLGGLILRFGFNDLFHSALYQFLVALFSLNLMLCIFTRPFNLYYVGFYAIHVSIIIILVGGIIGAVWGDKGYLEMHEGETASVYTSRKPGKGIQRFPFEIKLNDFTVKYKEPEHRLYVFRKDSKEHAASAVLREGKNVAFEGLPAKVLPAMRVVSLSAKRLNPNQDTEPIYDGKAVLEASDGKRYSFDTAQNDRMELNGYILAYTIEPLIGEYRSNITIKRKSGSELTWNLIVNGPLNVDGYRLYQANYRKDENGKYTISGFEVVYDPGIPIAFAGFWLLVAGVFWHFYFRPYLIRKRRSAK